MVGAVNENAKPAKGHPVIQFFKSAFTGIGQCILSGNWMSGILIVAAVAYSNWQAAIWFVVGSATAQLVGHAFKANKMLIEAGFFGFAGGFAGVLTGTYIMMNVPHVPGEMILLLIITSVMVVPMVTAFTMLFAKLNLSSLALPIVGVVWLMTAGFMFSGASNHLPAAAEAAEATAAVAPYSWKTVVFGVLSAFGQCFMHGNPVTGAIILLAVLVNSRIAGLVGIIGGVLVACIDIWLGFPEARIASGELLFNSIVTVMALSGFLLYLDYRSFIYALLGGMLAQFVYIGADFLLKPTHLPAMVIGFAVVAIIFHYAAYGLDFVTPVPLMKISKAENCIIKNGKIPT